MASYSVIFLAYLEHLCQARALSGSTHKVQEIRANVEWLTEPTPAGKLNAVRILQALDFGAAENRR